MAGIARGRLSEERKSWRKDHPHVRCRARSPVQERIPGLSTTAFLGTQGFVAKPVNMPDGSQNILSWEAVIPAKSGGLWDGARVPLTMTFTEDYPSKPPECKFKLVNMPGAPCRVAHGRSQMR
eukprot:4155926-Prymnesium_polylepis.1